MTEPSNFCASPDLPVQGNACTLMFNRIRTRISPMSYFLGMHRQNCCIWKSADSSLPPAFTARKGRGAPCHLPLSCLSVLFLSPGHTERKMKPGRCWAVNFSAEVPVASPKHQQSSQHSAARAPPAEPDWGHRAALQQICSTKGSFSVNTGRLTSPSTTSLN